MTEQIYTPEVIRSLLENEVFVFGSNRNGRHMGGAACVARERFGAINGVGTGIQGQSYAIPTLGERMERLSLEEIGRSIDQFIEFAEENPDRQFLMTKIGCGIAGFKLEEIAEIFKVRQFPENVTLPREFSI